MTGYIAQWRAAGEAGDATAAVAALAEDVELVSPLTDRFTFRGHRELEELLTSVFEVFTGIRYEAEFREGRRAVLLASGYVGAVRLQETQYLELDEEGRILRLTLMMRPLAAATRFVRMLGPRVASRQGRPGTAGVLTVAGTFLDSVVAGGDRVFLPMARPDRPGRPVHPDPPGA